MQIKLDWRVHDDGCMTLRGFPDDPDLWVPFFILSDQAQGALIANGLPVDTANPLNRRAVESIG